jgi:DNA polymerase-1
MNKEDMKKLVTTTDYEKIEIGLAAIGKYKVDTDMHTATATEIFNKPAKDITYEERKKAKAVNFGIAYGMKYE